MGLTWNTKPAQRSITQLKSDVADLTQEALAALRAGGEYSRDYIVADARLARAKQALRVAEAEVKRRAELDAMTPEEIADRVMKR